MYENSRKPWRLAVAGAGVVAVTLTGCGAGGGGQEPAAGGLDDMEPIVLTMNEINPEASVIGRAWTAFMDEVEEKSDGKITFDTYWSAALLPGNEMLTGVSSGVVDMGQILPNNFPQELPVGNLMIQMGSMPSDSFPLGTLQGAAAAQEMYATSDELQAELEGANMTALAVVFPYIQYDLLCTTPIDTPADAAGKRVRTPGGVWNGELEALGMVPVPMPFGETYEALQRGVIDCVALMPAANMDSGLVEIAKEFTPVAMSGFLGAYLGFNLDTWNSLPVEAQQILQDAAVLWWQEYQGGAIGRYADMAIDGPKYFDLVYHDPSELDEIVIEAQEDALAALGASDVPGVEDTAAFIDSYQELLDKWSGILTDDLGLEELPRDADSIRDSWSTGRGFDIAPIVERLKLEAFDPYRVQ
jgi:TRAP-type C4-dicarboxylate transport system substrate-binding protein